MDDFKRLSGAEQLEKLTNMPRAAVQKLAKELGVKANGKTAEIVDRILEVLPHQTENASSPTGTPKAAPAEPALAMSPEVTEANASSRDPSSSAAQEPDINKETDVPGADRSCITTRELPEESRDLGCPPSDTSQLGQQLQHHARDEACRMDSKRESLGSDFPALRVPARCQSEQESGNDVGMQLIVADPVTEDEVTDRLQPAFVEPGAVDEQTAKSDVPLNAISSISVPEPSTEMGFEGRKDETQAGAAEALQKQRSPPPSGSETNCKDCFRHDETLSSCRVPPPITVPGEQQKQCVHPEDKAEQNDEAIAEQNAGRSVEALPLANAGRDISEGEHAACMPQLIGDPGSADLEKLEALLFVPSSTTVAMPHSSPSPPSAAPKAEPHQPTSEPERSVLPEALMQVEEAVFMLENQAASRRLPTAESLEVPLVGRTDSGKCTNPLFEDSRLSAGNEVQPERTPLKPPALACQQAFMSKQEKDAFEKGRKSGIWEGMNQAKLEYLEDQWSNLKENRGWKIPSLADVQEESRMLIESGFTTVSTPCLNKKSKQLIKDQQRKHNVKPPHSASRPLARQRLQSPAAWNSPRAAQAQKPRREPSQYLVGSSLSKPDASTPSSASRRDRSTLDADSKEHTPGVRGKFRSNAQMDRARKAEANFAARRAAALAKVRKM